MFAEVDERPYKKRVEEAREQSTEWHGGRRGNFSSGLNRAAFGGRTNSKTDRPLHCTARLRCRRPCTLSRGLDLRKGSKTAAAAKDNERTKASGRESERGGPVTIR